MDDVCDTRIYLCNVTYIAFICVHDVENEDVA